MFQIIATLSSQLRRLKTPSSMPGPTTISWSLRWKLQFGNNDFQPSYPASYTEDNIIAVAATDNRDRLASFSNFGVTSVDIGAPALTSSVLCRQPALDFYPTPKYEYSDGTSMASQWSLALSHSFEVSPKCSLFQHYKRTV